MITVLLVDDEPSLLEMTRAILEQDGEIAVDCVLSGAEALRRLEEREYDVIVADYEMPGIDGIELLKEVKARGLETPFIIFTGKGREHVVIEALNCGADFYLRKGDDPDVQFAELGNMIRKAAVRKRTHESEGRYRAVVEDQTDFICRFSPDWTYVFVNEAYCRYFGKTRDEIIGRKFRHEVPAEDHELFRSYLASLTKESPVAGFDHPVVTPGGEVRWHRWVIRAIFDSSGKVTEYQSVGRDITDRKAHEEEVRCSERRLADIIDFLPDATFAIDREGKVIAWNRAIEEMTGVLAGEMLGQGDYAYAVPFYGKRRPILIDLIFSPEEEILEHQYTAVMRGGPAVMGETCVPSPKGRKVTLWGVATPLFNESGEITGAIESIRDITDRKKAEEALIQVNRKLNLLSSVTRHDILNQLSVLFGYLEISAGTVTDPVLSANLARSLRAAGAIKQQILFTRDYQDVGVTAPQWHDLVATWQHAAASAGQPSSTLSGSPLPNDPRSSSSFSLLHDRSCEGLSLYADPLLGKVFSNLIENVVKHGGNATMVRLSSHPSPEGMIVVCEDDGRGVPVSLKETIFQRGYGSNTGYGLFLAREILSITGLSIRETGVEGNGGRFEILVPHGSFRFTDGDRSGPDRI